MTLWKVTARLAAAGHERGKQPRLEMDIGKLNYTTGGSQTFSGAPIDDWFDDGMALATQPVGVTLIHGLDRLSSNGNRIPLVTRTHRNGLLKKRRAPGRRAV